MSANSLTSIETEKPRDIARTMHIAKAGTSVAEVHRPSHLNVIGRVPRYRADAPRIELSAVVVPTSRAVEEVGAGIALAARIAEAKDSQLIILRSGAATAVPFPRDLVPRTSRPTLVLDLSLGAGAVLPMWRNSAHVVGALHRDNDVSLKRNIALLIGQMCNWSSVLLLDDDISITQASRLSPDRFRDHSRAEDVDPMLRIDDVLADFAEYAELQAAGYLQKDFDDNSVVCHARRLIGRPQDGFISGGALVVRCGGRIPFFPAAYNEDWLFFFYAMLEAKHSFPSSTVKLVGSVHQKAYYPFLVSRARSEELGDVLAEGLFAVLGRTREEILATARLKEYWQETIWHRQNMILELIQEGRAQGSANDGVWADLDSALRAALSIYEGSVERWAAELAEYFRTLMLDVHDWYDLLEGMTPNSSSDGLDLAEALAVLGLNEGVVWLPAKASSVVAAIPLRPAVAVRSDAADRQCPAPGGPAAPVTDRVGSRR